MASDLAKRYSDKAAFVHLEVWRDGEANAINQAAADWVFRDGGLTEPWVFLVGADGKVVAPVGQRGHAGGDRTAPPSPSLMPARRERGWGAPSRQTCRPKTIAATDVTLTNVRIGQVDSCARRLRSIRPLASIDDPRPGRHGARPRLLFVARLMLVALLGPASPAFAHAAGGSDISNFSSTITSVSAMTSDGQPTQAGTLPNVSWRVVANDALLEVTNRSGEELLVVGYQGEPYLRVGPDGIWLNANSPASYLNGDRFAAVDVPAEANADAEPRWIRQPDQPTYAWHDHRIHWMSPTTDPPQVQESGGKTETTVFDWTVPYKVGSQTYAVAGTLRWVPPPPAGPWLLAGGAVTTLPFLVALTRARGSARRRALLRVGAVLAAGLVLTGVIHLVDDISAVPATFGQNLAETAKWGSFLLIGAVGAVVACGRATSHRRDSGSR
jgi:hypothetical protein